MNRSINPLSDRLSYDDGPIRHTHFNPYYIPFSRELTDPALINGIEYINLASNNYLGLACDERIKGAYIEAIEKYGVTMCATPVAGGYSTLFEKVRDRLSGFIGVESLMIYPSCYQANNGLFTALARKDDLIIFDRNSHSSLIQGIRAAGCKALPFGHNDIESLEFILSNKSAGHDKIFVVTESVFSTEGSVAPFKEIVDLCEKFDAIPVVDDSHGIGVLGERGGGVLSHFGIAGFNGIYTASLGKAMVNNCGIVAGRREIIDYLKYFSSHLVYSTAVAPATLAGILKTLEILEAEYPQISGRLYGYYEAIKTQLLERGLRLTESAAPINSIIAGDTEQTFIAAKKLFESSIVSTPFVFPSVGKKEGKIRLIAGANLKESTIDRALDIFRKIDLN